MGSSTSLDYITRFPTAGCIGLLKLEGIFWDLPHLYYCSLLTTHKPMAKKYIKWVLDKFLLLSYFLTTWRNSILVASHLHRMLFWHYTPILLFNLKHYHHSGGQPGSVCFRRILKFIKEWPNVQSGQSHRIMSGSLLGKSTPPAYASHLECSLGPFKVKGSYLCCL